MNDKQIQEIVELKKNIDALRNFISQSESNYKLKNWIMKIVKRSKENYYYENEIVRYTPDHDTWEILMDTLRCRLSDMEHELENM